MAALLLLAILTLLIYHGVIFRSGIIYGKDTVVQGYPLEWYSKLIAKTQTSPTWFAYMMSGFPTTPAIYPTDALASILPPTRVVGWRYILHTMAAAALMFLMMRRFGCKNSSSMVGAIAFGFSAFFISKVYAGHGYAVWSCTWMPLTLLLLDRTIETRKAKLAVLTGASLGLQILGQHPQYVLYTIIAMALFAIWRIAPQMLRERNPRKVAGYTGLAALVAIFALLISAHHILPFMQITALSNRGGGTGYEYASSLSMHPAQMITAALPSFCGNPERQNSVFGALYWDSTMYIGLLPLILALIAFFRVKDPRASYFKVLALISIVLALGDHTPLYRLIYHIPGFSMVRAPGKGLFLYTFAFSALAAYGMELLISSTSRFHLRYVDRSTDRALLPLAGPMKKIERVFIFAFAALLAALVAWIVMKGPVLSIAEKMISARGDAAVVAPKLAGLFRLQLLNLVWATAFAGIGTAVVVALMRRRISIRVAAAVIIGVSFVDLWMYANPLLYTVNARKLFIGGDRGAIRMIMDDHTRFRILPLDTNAFQYTQGVLDGLESVNGYYPISLARYAAYTGAIENKPGYVDVSADISNYNSPLVDLLNAKYILSSKPLRTGNLRELHSGRIHVYLNPDAFPRAFIVHDAKSVRTPKDALAEIKRKDFDASRTVVLEGTDPLLRLSREPVTETALVTKHTPTELRISATAGSPGYLVLSEVYYPDWQAWVDGKPAQVMHANYLFRAVYLPQGKHEVRMEFVSKPYRIGLVMGSAALVIIAGMLAVGLKRAG
jgi:hypothetical protein